MQVSHTNTSVCVKLIHSCVTVHALLNILVFLTCPLASVTKPSSFLRRPFASTPKPGYGICLVWMQPWPEGWTRAATSPLATVRGGRQCTEVLPRELLFTAGVQVCETARKSVSPSLVSRTFALDCQAVSPLESIAGRANSLCLCCPGSDFHLPDLFHCWILSRMSQIPCCWVGCSQSLPL